jgi:hypothetical protein
MSANDGDLVDRMAKKHSVSPAAVQVVLAALRRGGGRMAQFSHAEFGGMSQWSSGMTMVGDMFNTQLQAKLDALCSDIAAHLDTSETAGGTRAERRSATVRRADRTTGGRPDWRGQPLSVRRTISDTQFFPRPGGWRSMIKAPFRYTTPDRIGFSESRRPKAPIGPSHSPARTGW